MINPTIGATETRTMANARAGDHVYRSKRWRRTRAVVLAEEPMCRSCGLPAQAVDHVIDIALGGAEYDRSNLRPLCHRCHNAKRAKHRFCVHGYPVGHCCPEGAWRAA